MKNAVKLLILCFYRDDSAIDRAKKIIDDWSIKDKGHRRLSWIKRSPDLISFIIVLPSKITSHEEADLYSQLASIPGLVFINSSFG